MTVISMVLAALLIGQAPAKGDEPAPAEAGEKTAPAVALFNGQDLAGWQQPLDNAADWEVIDGVLTGRGGGPAQPALLVTERQDFLNYHLRVVFGSNQPGGGWVELRRTGEDNIASFYAVSAVVGNDKQAKNRPTGNITRWKSYRYGDGWPIPRPSAPTRAAVGSWHTLDVIVTGNTVTSYLDGKKADAYTDRRPDVQPGGIGLFCRGDSTLKIKAIEVEELPAE